jgi:hypothetical protein
MNQSIASIATGLCAAPLLALAGFALTAALLPSGGGGSDQTIAQGYMGLLGGIALALVGFFAVGWIARRVVPEQHVQYLLVADVVLLVVGIAAWRGFLAGDRVLEYAEGRGVLQIELRIPRAIVGTEPIDTVVSIDFVGGSDLSDPHPERVRDDGDDVILPWETTPFRVRAWEISVFVRGEPVLFALPLPRRPAGSAEWSEWIRSSEEPASPQSDGMTLRYRFLVIPHGQ